MKALSLGSSLGEARWVVQGQALLVCGMSLVALFFSTTIALSFLLGGMACSLPTYLMYRGIFRYFGARAAPKMLKALYWGEIKKFICLIAIFSLALHWKNIAPGALFTGYVCAQAVYWFVPLRWVKRTP